MEIDEDQSAHGNGNIEAQVNKKKKQGIETTPVFRNLFSNIKPPIMKKNKLSWECHTRGYKLS